MEDISEKLKFHSVQCTSVIYWIHLEARSTIAFFSGIAAQHEILPLIILYPLPDYEVKVFLFTLSSWTHLYVWSLTSRSKFGILILSCFKA